MAPVARNSICWGIFMATSANLRYQLLSGFDERYMVRGLGRTNLEPLLPAGRWYTWCSAEEWEMRVHCHCIRWGSCMATEPIYATGCSAAFMRYM